MNSLSVAENKNEVGETQYLDDERKSDVKRELIDGQVYAMAGASMNHITLSDNLFSEFRTHLKSSPCKPAIADMKVKVGSNYFYPDVVVDCDFDQTQPYVTQSPVIIVEVLSKSTRRTDQTTKRLRYINLPSLLEYVLIEQDFVDIEVMRKSNDWRSSRYFLGDAITFESIDLTLSVEDIYDSVHNEDMLEHIKQKQV